MIYSFLENAKYVPAFAPKDITGAGVTGDWVRINRAQRLYIILQCGAWAGGTSAVTLEQGDSNAASGSALAFTKKYEGVALTDDVLAEVAVASNTFNLDTANECHIIEVKPEDLDDGNTHVRVVCATPGANADLLAGFYVLTGLDFQGKFPGTQID